MKENFRSNLEYSVLNFAFIAVEIRSMTVCKHLANLAKEINHLLRNNSKYNYTFLMTVINTI